MSPRGVAIPDVRSRLFEAADRVLEGSGPAGLSSRAIAAEAGTAAGLLFRHFADLDEFLAAYVASRVDRVRETARVWLSRPGSGTVAANLTGAALSIAPTASSLIDIVHGRPSLAVRLMADRHLHRAGIDQLEEAFAGYLEAERDLGRVARDTDTQAIAMALVASVHQLSLRHDRADGDTAARIRRVVGALASEISAEPPAG